MNGQQPQKKEWPAVAEELKILIHNSEISLELLRAQLKEALIHSRGK